MKSHIRKATDIMATKNFFKNIYEYDNLYKQNANCVIDAFDVAAKAIASTDIQFIGELKEYTGGVQFPELIHTILSLHRVLISIASLIKVEDKGICDDSLADLQNLVDWLHETALKSKILFSSDDEENIYGVLISMIHTTRLGSSLFCLLYPYFEKLTSLNQNNVGRWLGHIAYMFFRACFSGTAGAIVFLSAVDSAAEYECHFEDSMFYKGFCKQLRVFYGDVKDDSSSKDLKVAMGCISPYSLPKVWHEMSNKQKALLLTADTTMTTKQVNSLVRRADVSFYHFMEGFSVGMTLAHDDMFNAVESEKIHKNITVSNVSDRLYEDLKSSYEVLERRTAKEIKTLNETVESLKRRLKYEKPTKIREIVKEVKVEVSKEEDRREIEQLRSTVARQKEHIQALEEYKITHATQEQVIAQLHKQLKSMEHYIEMAQSSPESEDSRLTEEELSILKALKVHISMPECKGALELSKIMPRAKIDTAPLGKHGNVSLTPGYAVYLFCTKLSHSQFASWCNQVEARGYNICFSNTTGVTAICRSILDACKKGD